MPTRIVSKASLFPGPPHKYSYLENPSANPMRDAVSVPSLRPPVLIAIGGGGATHGTHPELDAFCLRHLRPGAVIGHVGAASGDDPDKSARVHAAFAPHPVRDLPMSADAAGAEAWAEGLDMIHVGGGDPVRLLDHWRVGGIDAVLLAAARRGVLLAGVSAGAMCWFESFLWRDGPRGLVPGTGLGLFPGAVTPHASTEPDRIGAMTAHVAAGRLPAGWAIDDGAALVMSGGAPAAVFPEVGPPHVHRIGPGAEGAARLTF